VGSILAAHGIAADAVLRAGGRDELAAELASGAKLGAPALLEDDATVVKCVASGAPGAARLRGAKRLVPFPGRAGAFVVLAADDAGVRGLYLVGPDAAGVRHERREETLGLLGMETATLELDGTPAERLGGAEVVLRTIEGARIAVAALLSGVGRGAVRHAARYAGERRQFDKPLSEFGAMKERLARADARVFAARATVHGAARLRDRGAPCAVAAARARLMAGEAAISAADDALQVYGGYGYSREYPAERFYRDARFIGFGEAHPATLAADLAADLAS
jgi:acyl-CoA dehydrogenase